MEVSCPQCQSVFAIELTQLRAHRGQVQCGRCEWAFSMPDTPETAEPLRLTTLPAPGRRGLQLAALVLGAFLVLQALWWGRAYVATLPGVHSLLVAIAEHMGPSISWPQDLRYLNVTQAHWVDNAVQGEISNEAAYVQALPKLRLILTGNHGELLDQVLMGPADYLPGGIRRGQGLLPGQRLPFRIPAPGKEHGTGFQVLPEPH